MNLFVFRKEKTLKWTLNIFELTVPLNMNIENRHQEKMQKYTPFITDITGFNCKVNCFEVSSTGYINSRNKETLLNLHKFMRTGIKRTSFLENINSLAWYRSYKVWLSREDPEFAVPPFLIPHLGDLPPARQN